MSISPLDRLQHKLIPRKLTRPLGFCCALSDYMQIHDIKVNFLGRREMLPPDVLEAVEAMERDTAGHQT